ncbi:MAG: asparagine synthase (glutamine-hydrolyzing) [Chitinophagaceae bacterium]
MCGIAGICSRNSRLVVKEQLQAATQTLTHRGPEGEGYYNDTGTVALGHRRLCIIDLSEEAAQPFHYADRYHLVYNGELYNYLELKEELSRKGYRFHTTSDTEVLMVSFVVWGKECLHHFDGAFAFAIWDEKEQVLFAARDRFGEKPFFFFYDEERLVFASEIKALWKMGIAKEVNKAMLYNFLTIGYTTNPSDPQETFYNNIHKLPAASLLTFSLQANELIIEKYWQPVIDVNHTIMEDEAIEKFQYLFAQSIRKRLRSDVAIGTSLSGGLDSSAVIAFCNQQQATQYTHKCFTAAFEGFEKNEKQYATKVANEFGLEHHLVTINEEGVIGLMELIMQQQDEPFSTASPIAQYKVFEAAKEAGVTVLLDGQGADEILAGYSKYYKWYWQELRGTKLNYELRAARALGVQEDFDWKNSLASFFPQFTASLLEGKKAKQAFKQSDLNQDFAFSNKQNFYYTLPASLNLNSALYYNTFVNGLEELLRLADRNSMAHAVEVRLPFLNGELVEFLFTLPPHFKIQHGWSKWLLRKATENCLPPEIVWRKDKVGFEPPQKLWMQNKDVQEQLMEGRKKLVAEHILDASVLKKGIIPKHTHEAESKDWRYWSAAALVH